MRGQNVLPHRHPDFLRYRLLLHDGVDEVQLAKELVRIFFELLGQHEELTIDNGVNQS